MWQNIGNFILDHWEGIGFFIGLLIKRPQDWGKTDRYQDYPPKSH